MTVSHRRTVGHKHKPHKTYMNKYAMRNGNCPLFSKKSRWIIRVMVLSLVLRNEDSRGLGLVCCETETQGWGEIEGIWVCEKEKKKKKKTLY